MTALWEHVEQQRHDQVHRRIVSGYRRLVELYAAGDVSSLEQVIPPDYVGHPSRGDRINIARIIDGRIVEECNTWESLKIPQS